MKTLITHRPAYRRTALLLLGLLLAGLLAACGDNATSTPASSSTTAATSGQATTAAAAGASTGGSSPGVTDTEIVLGSWGPQTGPVATSGTINRTMAAYFKKINDEGGVNGRKIKFIYEDDAYTPSRTVSVVKKLVEQDKVFALVGGLGTAQNIAVMDYLTANNVPNISPSTGSSTICCPMKKTVFAGQTNYTVEATLMTRYALDNLKAKKLAVFYQNDPLGKEGLDGVKAELKARNSSMEIFEVPFEATDKDFSSHALKLQGSGADTLLTFALPFASSGVIKENQKLGYKPSVIMSYNSNTPQMFDLVGNALDGVYVTSTLRDYNATSDSQVAAYLDFMKKYNSGEQVGQYTQAGVAYSQIILEGIKRAGKNLTRESLIAALEGIKDWDGSLFGKISYNSSSHQGSNSIIIMQANASDKKFVPKTEFLEYKPANS
jgi:branched-chain amino acid transport system substrate-binding protein